MVYQLCLDLTDHAERVLCSSFNSSWCSSPSQALNEELKGVLSQNVKFFERPRKNLPGVPSGSPLSLCQSINSPYFKEGLIRLYNAL